MRLRLKVFQAQRGLWTLDCDAAEEASVRDALARQGGLVVSVHRQAGLSLRFAGAADFPLVLFAQELVALLSAGLPLVESIEALAEKEREPAVRSALDGLARDLRGGRALSQALERRPDLFPPVFRAAIESSERTGEVPEALRRYIAYAKQFQAVQDQLVGALIYPALLLSLGMLVVVFLLVYVVPRFSVVFADRLDELPFLSGAVVRLGMWTAEQPAWLLVMGLVLLLLAALTPGRRRWLALGVRAASAVPAAADWIHGYRLARLYRSLGLLLRGGIAAVPALQMVRSLLPSMQAAAMDAAIAEVRSGRSLSAALATHGLTTSVTQRLLGVGEQSGRMGDLLEAAADFLDQQLARRLDRMVRVAEPLLMLGIGALVGGIVILMYLPIFQLADAIQ